MYVSGQFYEPATLLQEESSQYPFDRELGGPQSRSGSGDKEKKFLPLPKV
jgi:hypothetical protein